MTDDITKKLLQFALKNSELKNLAKQPDDIENEIVRNAAKLSISEKPNEKKSGKQLINFFADDGNQAAINHMEHQNDIHDIRSVRNTINASVDRTKKPSKEELEKFKKQYEYDNGKTRGWKKAAYVKYDISPATIRRILQNNAP